MRNYIDIVCDTDSCFCNACGNRLVSEGNLLKVSFIHEAVSGNSNSQSFGLCRECAIKLSNKLLQAICDK